MADAVRNISLTLTLSAEQGDKVLVVERTIRPKYSVKFIVDTARGELFEILGELARKAEKE